MRELFAVPANDVDAAMVFIEHWRDDPLYSPKYASQLLRSQDDPTESLRRLEASTRGHRSDQRTKFG